MKKRILSILLAVLMLLSVLPVSALAATEPEQPQSNITATKKAEWANGTDGIARVTIEVSGKAPEESVITQTTDIVLVMDRSLSMTNNESKKLTNAKAAANDFAEKLMKDNADKKVRIAVVGYAKKVINNDGFSDDLSTVKGRIDAVNTDNFLHTDGTWHSTRQYERQWFGIFPEDVEVSENWNGTNIQAGIHAAKELLDGSTAKNKIMITLTDGYPNYSFRFVANADYEDCNRYYASMCKEYGPLYGKIKNVGSFTVDYSDYVYESDNFYLNQNGNAKVTATCTEHGGTTTETGVYKDGKYTAKAKKTNHGVATIWEAAQAKASGIEIYAIGYGIAPNSDAEKTMKSVATADTAQKKYYYNSSDSASAISSVLNAIAKSVLTYTAYDPVVTDVISDDFDYYTDDDHQPTTSDTKDMVSPSGQTVTWDLAAEQLDTTKHTLTFYVKYKHLDNPAAPGTNLFTNECAELEYAKEKGKDRTEKQDIDNASVLSLSKTVSYTVSGDVPNGYMKPDDAYVWAGRDYTVADTPANVTTDDGTYTFDGWYNGENKAEGKITINDNTTLTGEWKFTPAPPAEHKVTFNLTEGAPEHGWMDGENENHVATKKYTYVEDATYNMETVSLATGYVFSGWYTDENPNGDKVSGQQKMGNTDITYYGKVTKDTSTNTVTVTKTWADGADHDTDSVTILITLKTGPETEVLDKDNKWRTTLRYPAFAFDQTTGEGTANTVISVVETKINNDALTDGKLEVMENGKKVGEWTSSVVPSDKTYTVTNTYKAAELPQPKYTLSYEFVSGTPGKTLPTMTNPNSVQLDEGAALTVPTVNPMTVDDQANNGSWTFKGWYLDEELNNPVKETDTMPAKAKTIYGKWTFTPNQQPVEYVPIDLSIDKTVLSKRGTAPSEWFEFEVYYYNNSNQKVVISGVEPLKVYVGEGDKNANVDFTIYPTAEQMNNWPAGENNGHYAYVRELAGRTEGMSYASMPIEGVVIQQTPVISSAQVSTFASTQSAIKLSSLQGWADDFYFTNEYTKPTDGKDVTPAKVSPQLNRDDHVAYIMGYPDGNVRPEGEITRAEACTIFFRLLTKESRDYYFSRTNDYTDVSRTDWFNNAISTLSNAGIVTGYADGTFRPDQPITRGEMAKIIANFARLGGATKSFTDLSGHWAKSYVELAAGNGWIAGYPDGTFRPDQKITRAETVTMINRVLERVPAKESRLLSRSVMLTFPDNEPGEWYYIAVQEASNSHTYQRSAYETAGDEMWLRLIENVDWTKLEK